MKRSQPQNAKRVLQHVTWCKRAFPVSQFILGSAKAIIFSWQVHSHLCFLPEKSSPLILPSVVTLPHLSGSLGPVFDSVQTFAASLINLSQELHVLPLVLSSSYKQALSNSPLGAWGIVVAVSVICCLSLTSVLGGADHCILSGLNLTGPQQMLFQYLVIFFSNFWINVSLRHSASESLHNSCTCSCPLIYRSVLFQFQVLFSAMGWTEGIMEENRLYIILDLEMTLNFSTDLYELSENNWKSRLGAQKIKIEG